MRRNLTMFIAGFTIVVVAGTAMAQLGDQTPDQPVAAPLEPTTTTDVIVIEAKTPAEAPTKALDKAETAHKTEAAAKTEKTEAVEPAPVEKTPDLEEMPADTTPPPLAILHPVSGQTVESDNVVFEGTTEPGARVFAGDYEADVNAEGGWRIVLWVKPGETTAVFTAKDEAGNRTTASVTVVYAPVAAEFTAHQKYGESPESFEKFWGTGRPSATVTATSAHGSNSTVIGEGGEWLLKVEFDAPKDTPFPVTIADSDGHSKTFTFIWHPIVKEFTAHQQYGSCAENPPYDVFYGTGTPGLVVEVGSPYGSGRAVVNEAGHWEMKVVFAEAPYDTPFEVVLATTGGHEKVFAFTRLGSEG